MTIIIYLASPKEIFEDICLRIRCQRAESNNTKLVLQLTRQGRYINELLNQDQIAATSNNAEERILSINQSHQRTRESQVTLMK
jgi:hypothetical protein